MSPATARPPTVRPTSVPQTGTPVMKARVPSIGIDDPDERALRGLGVPFLADDGVVGEAGADQLADGDLGLAIGLGDRVESVGPACCRRRG